MPDRFRIRTSLARDRAGVVAIQIALLLIVLVGFASLGSEVVVLFLDHRTMQSAADSSALAGATAVAIGDPTDYTIEARAVASAAGFTSGIHGTTVTVNRPPSTGPNSTNASAVEVIVDQPQTLGMISLFRSAIVDVGARAVAIVGSSSQYCMLSLDPSASAALDVHNNADVSNSHCGVAVNSSSSSSIVVSNNGVIAGPVNDHGNWSLSNNAQLTSKQIVSNAPVVADPYANVAAQTVPSCTSQSGSGSASTVNLMPGHFCTGWSFSSDVTLNLAAGTYYVDQSLGIGNNAVVNATAGVTIVVNGNYAIGIGNNTQLNVTAPSSGAYAGIALFGSRTGTASVTQTFSNNTTMNITGAVYFPNQIVDFANNGSTGTSGCTQVIGRIINVQNNVNLDNQCSGTGVKPIGAQPTRLVE